MTLLQRLFIYALTGAFLNGIAGAHYAHRCHVAYVPTTTEFLTDVVLWPLELAWSLPYVASDAPPFPCEDHR